MADTCSFEVVVLVARLVDSTDGIHEVDLLLDSVLTIPLKIKMVCYLRKVL